MNTIFISFYNSFPATSGAYYITSNLFELWPGGKKLFVLTNEINKTNNKNIFQYYILSNNAVIKILNLPFYLYFIIKKINISKDKNILFEGASWSGFTLFFYIIFKFLNSNIKFIYHSHNVDYDLRKKNPIIGFITAKIEKFIIKNFDIFTAVSKKDQKRFLNLYKTKPILLENGINIVKNKKKINKKKYFLFSGSLLFKENKYAYSELIKILDKNNFFIKSNYYLYITGNDIKNKISKKYIVNLGILNYRNYISTLQNAKLCLYPMKNGPGTKIKILEALCHKVPILTTMSALNGIDIKNKKLITFKNEKEMNEKIIKICEKKIDLNSVYNDTIIKYDFKKIIKNFYKKNKF